MRAFILRLMKRRKNPEDEASLSEKRALIRALIEQTGWGRPSPASEGQTGVEELYHFEHCRIPEPDPLPRRELAEVIPFPSARRKTRGS